MVEARTAAALIMICERDRRIQLEEANKALEIQRAMNDEMKKEADAHQEQISQLNKTQQIACQLIVMDRMRSFIMICPKYKEKNDTKSISITAALHTLNVLCELHHIDPTISVMEPLDARTCTIGQVKAAYRRLSLRLHPDKCKLQRQQQQHSQEDEYTELFKVLEPVKNSVLAFIEKRAYAANLFSADYDLSSQDAIGRYVNLQKNDVISVLSSKYNQLIDAFPQICMKHDDRTDSEFDESVRRDNLSFKRRSIV